MQHMLAGGNLVELARQAASDAAPGAARSDQPWSAHAASPSPPWPAPWWAPARAREGAHRRANFITLFEDGGTRAVFEPVAHPPPRSPCPEVHLSRPLTSSVISSQRRPSGMGSPPSMAAGSTCCSSGMVCPLQPAGQRNISMGGSHN